MKTFGLAANETRDSNDPYKKDDIPKIENLRELLEESEHYNVKRENFKISDNKKFSNIAWKSCDHSTENNSSEAPLKTSIEKLPYYKYIVEITEQGCQFTGENEDESTLSKIKHLLWEIDYRMEEIILSD